jgi:hypothetical protein
MLLKTELYKPYYIPIKDIKYFHSNSYRPGRTVAVDCIWNQVYQFNSSALLYLNQTNAH